MRHHPARAILCVMLLSLLAGCGQPPVVTVSGTPVSTPAFVAATIAAHGMETAAVALGDWLIARHAQACAGKSQAAQEAELACLYATAALKTYAIQFTPPLIAALQATREQLKLVASSPTATTQERLADALAALTTAFTAAETWAHTSGYLPAHP